MRSLEGMEHDDVVRRLSSLGRRPVEPHVAERHAALLASVAAPALPPSRRFRPVLAGTLLAGALLGGTGLAAALPGSLPDQAGSVARAVLEAVNLADDGRASDPSGTTRIADKAGHTGTGAADAAPEGTDAATDDAGTDDDAARRGPTKDAAHPGAGGVTRFTEGCTAGAPPTAFTGNHGQYVRSHPDDPATPDANERQVAAQSECGKPLPAVHGGEEDGDQDEDADDDDGRVGGPGRSPAGDRRTTTAPTTTATTPDGATRTGPPGQAGDDHPSARGDRGRGQGPEASPDASRSSSPGAAEQAPAKGSPPSGKR